MKKKLRYILDKVNTDYIILIIIAIILAIPMFSQKLDVYADDGIQHIARAFGTYETIKEGVLPKIIWIWIFMGFVLWTIYSIWNYNYANIY